MKFRTPLATVAVGVAALAAWLSWSPRAPSIPLTLKGGTLSIIQAGDDPQAKAAPDPALPQAAPTAEPIKRGPTVARLDAEYRRLLARDSTAEDHARAYSMAEDCIKEARIADKVNLVRPRCALEQGTWQDRQLRKIAVRDYALLARFNGVGALADERTDAFADDPAEWERVMAEAMRVGVERGEPVALRRAAFALRQGADELAAKGQLTEAREAYMAALSASVGAGAGLAKLNASVAAGTGFKAPAYDWRLDPAIESFANVLSESDRMEAINAGLKRAQQWRVG